MPIIVCLYFSLYVQMMAEDKREDTIRKEIQIMIELIDIVRDAKASFGIAVLVILLLSDTFDY